MRLKSILCLALLSLSTSTQAGWLCQEAASIRDGRILTACGIGHGDDEAKARANALETAYKELDAICDRSVDCKDKELYIEPIRNECMIEGKQYKCYRGITATITDRKRAQSAAPAKEKLEVIIKKEEQEIERVSRYRCDYNYPEIESLLKQNKITEAVNEIKNVPFKEKCSEHHYKFMRTLLKLGKFPNSYVDYLYSLVSTFEGDWSDNRPLMIFEYLYEKGDWDTTGWKQIYLALKTTNPRLFSTYSRVLFHLKSKNRDQEKVRVQGLMTDIEKGNIGFPDKINYFYALSTLCSRAESKEDMWYLEALFTGEFSKASKVEREKELLSCLKKTDKWDLDANDQKRIYSWMGTILKNGADSDDSRNFMMDYVRGMNNELERLDETIPEEETKISSIKVKKESVISLLKIHSEKLFSKVEAEHQRKTVIEFCLTEGLQCKVVPSLEALKKRLTSQKNKTVEDATFYLTMMPDVAFKLKSDLFNLLETHKDFRVRGNSMKALVNTPIKSKEEIDILLKHSWNRVYDYGEFAKKFGKRLLVSLIPIVEDEKNKNRDLAIEMLGLIGKDAKEALPILEDTLTKKLHYSTENRIKKSIEQISKLK